MVAFSLEEKKNKFLKRLGIRLGLGMSFYRLFTDLPVNYFYRFTGKF
jgi:hypothetical protein